MPVDFKCDDVLIKDKKWIRGGIGHHLNMVNPTTTEAAVQRISVSVVLYTPIH